MGRMRKRIRMKSRRRMLRTEVPIYSERKRMWVTPGTRIRVGRDQLRHWGEGCKGVGTELETLGKDNSRVLWRLGCWERWSNKDAGLERRPPSLRLFWKWTGQERTDVNGGRCPGMKRTGTGSQMG